MRRATALLVALLFVGSLAPSVRASETPEETIRRAREELTRARAERAAVARDLDVLEAEDEELLSALEALNEQVDAQELLVVEARSQLDRIHREQGDILDTIVMTRQSSEIVRLQSIERTIRTYVQPVEQESDQLFAGASVHDANRRQTLLRFATLSDVDLRDELRGLDDELALLDDLAATKEAEAAAQEAALSAILQDLEANVAAQEAIRAQLSDKIAIIEGQLDEMARQEREIGNLIRSKQAEIAAREARNRQADLGNVSPQGLIMPTSGRITSGFGNRRHPILGTVRRHAGVDFSGASGNPIWAAQSGTVISAGVIGGYGNTVIIDHGGYTTLYAHMSRILVSNGQRVQQGTRIGNVGSTGLSTGPHLHFEVRVGGAARDPAKYLPR